MGYNDPMPKVPEQCDCGTTPEVWQLGQGIGKVSGKSVVQCGNCFLTGPIVMGGELAVFFWRMKNQREIAPVGKRFSLNKIPAQ